MSIVDEIKVKNRIKSKKFYDKHMQNPEFREKMRVKARTAYHRNYQRRRRQDPEYLRKGYKNQIKRRFKIFTLLGGKCVKCGETDFRLFDIHHKNGERKGEYRYIPNEPISELELLCVKCHRLEHWEKGDLRKIWREIAYVNT